MSSATKDHRSVSSTSSADEAGHHPCDCPPSTPGRTAYLALRTLNVLVAVAIVPLSVVSKTSYSQRIWLSILLSISLTSLGCCATDLCLILFTWKRFHPWQRALHDGCLALGFAATAGLMIHYALPEIELGGGAGKLAEAAIALMFTEM